MKIDHLAIWVQDLEKMRLFYCAYFDAKAGEKYSNPKKNFESYFLQFGEGARLELMKKTGICKLNDGEAIGLAHFAISVATKTGVDKLTQNLRERGYTVLSDPRTTGDGYYESVILDPEGNHVEITL